MVVFFYLTVMKYKYVNIILTELTAPKRAEFTFNGAFEQLKAILI